MAESDLEDKVLLLFPFLPVSFVPTARRGSNACPALLFLALASQLNAIRKTNSNLVIIGKPTNDVKEEYDAEVEEDDVDNVDESDGDDFDQETG
ncbi:unnamed protein product [Triticum turgidum subsp. durum]|uniref:Uncharacterized protein n=1 Tax=Triticum turgidum subsp. durum TaxID=4567 RepID=A0A9R0YLZ6_TRITD|nr:unnamed protein product [Triticum turgidum subsp. durum]